MPVEIINAMATHGLEHETTTFTWYHYRSDLRTRWIESLSPRLRPMMIVVGRKIGS